MRSFAKIAVAGVVLVVLSAAVGLTAGEAKDEPNAAPCLVVWRTDGMRAPAELNEGLELAVWADGMMLSAARRDALGKPMLVGKLDPNDLSAALSAIREAGFHKLTRNYQVPDSSYVTLCVRDGGNVSTRAWHENLAPGFGGDVNTDAEYRAFVRTWKKTRAAIEGLAPVELHRLENKDEFRGYVVGEPMKTSWRPR